MLTIEGSPGLAVITSSSLCFVSHNISTDEFHVDYECNFVNLLAAVVGPFSQQVIVLNEDKDWFSINTGLSRSVASDLICHLEIALRRWCMVEKRMFHFHVTQINDLKSINVLHDFLPDNAFTNVSIFIMNNF